MDDYEPGNLISESLDYMHCVNNEFKGYVCDWCLKKSSPISRRHKWCARCTQNFYCSRECARKDWKAGHKFKECDLFQLVKPSTSVQSEDVINLDLFTLDPKAPGNMRDANKKTCVIVDMLTRLCLKLRLDPKAKNKTELYDKAKCGIDDLHSFIGQPKEQATNYVVSMVALRLARVDVVYEVDELKRLCGVVLFNAVELSVGFPGKDDLGLVLNFEWAKFEHSCSPNTAIVFDGRKMLVRATKYIDRDAGETPTKCYHNSFLLYQSRNSRRNYLDKILGINCKCARCKSPDDFGFNYKEYIKLFKSETRTYEAARDLELKAMLMQKKVEGKYNLETTSRLYNCWQMARRGGSEEEMKVFMTKFMKHVHYTYGPELAVEYANNAEGSYLRNNAASTLQKKYHEGPGEMNKFINDAIKMGHFEELLRTIRK